MTDNVNINNDDKIIKLLNENISPELISYRKGTGNNNYAYIKSDVHIETLNKIFGPLGWEVKSNNPVLGSFNETRKVKIYNSEKYENKEFKVFTATTLVELRIKARSHETSDTIFIQSGIGYGDVDANRSSKEALGLAIKGAETDGFKRCIKFLGRAFGLYLTNDGKQEDLNYAHYSSADHRNKAIRMRKNNQENNQENNKTYNQSINKSNNQPKTEKNNVKDDNNKNKNKKVREPNLNYNLEMKPLTREDQFDFGSTLLSQLEKMDKNKQNAFILEHKDNIEGLDSHIKNKLIDKIKGFDINY